MERQQNVLSTLSYYPLSFSPLVRGREWAAIVLFTMVFAGLACDSGGKNAGDDPCDAPKGDRPDWCEASDSNVGDDTTISDDIKNSTGNDTFNVDTEDPLAEYMWLEGQWKRESVNGKPDDLIVDVTIEAWDPNLGAEVHGFKPFNISYIKKNAETNEFILFVEYEDGSYAEGLADPNTLTLEIDSCAPNYPCSNTIYLKL